MQIAAEWGKRRAKNRLEKKREENKYNFSELRAWKGFSLGFSRRRELRELAEHEGMLVLIVINGVCAAGSRKQTEIAASALKSSEWSGWTIAELQVVRLIGLIFPFQKKTTPLAPTFLEPLMKEQRCRTEDRSELFGELMHPVLLQRWILCVLKSCRCCKSSTQVITRLLTV